MGEWKNLAIQSGTGWKELTIEAGTGWKELYWESIVNIDVGPACVAGTTGGSTNYTYLLLENPANADGSLTTVCLYVTVVDTFYVGVFYNTTGNNYKCRSAANLGALNIGENNKAVDLSIVTGDLIGFFSSSGKAAYNSASNGLIFCPVSGNKCVVDNVCEYSSPVDYNRSIHGKNY